MALRFAKLTRPAIRALEPGKKLHEHGIWAERLKSGDVRYGVNLMVDGVRVHRILGCESDGITREQAERFKEKLRTEAREDRLNLPKARKLALTFKEGAERYIERLEEEGGASIPRKRQHLKTYLGPSFSGRLEAITESDVRAYSKRRLAIGAKAATVNRELATLSHMLKACARWGWISRDKLPSIPKLKEGPGRIIALSPAQCSKLLEAAIADQDADLWLFVLVCLHTSMRHGEARRLRWEHYDVNRRRFFIPQAKAGQREQPVSPELAAIIQKEMKSRGVTEGYLFVGGPGSKTGYRHTFRKAFARAVDAAKMDPSVITPHVLRHTAITKLVKAGVDLPTIQRVSAHKTLSMVLRYTHVDGMHIDEAVARLEMPIPKAKEKGAKRITQDLHHAMGVKSRSAAK